MRDWSEIDRKVMWYREHPLMSFGIRTGIMKLPTGVECSVVAGDNEEGYEHVSIELRARRLPTWEEMCYVKDVFWTEDEEVVQIHPKKDVYVK